MKHVSSYGGAVPAVAGWYAIGHDEHYFGLESSRVYVYIGTTDNLRRRLAEHQPSTEQNPGLKRHLQKIRIFEMLVYSRPERHIPSKLADNRGEVNRQIQTLL